LAWSVWLMAPKTACKTVDRSLLSVLSLVELVVDPDVPLLEESVVDVPLVEPEELPLLLLFPSNALMMACSISWRRFDVVEPLLDDAPLPPVAALEPALQPPDGCRAVSDWLDDACEALPLCACSRKRIKALLEPLAPLIADMGRSLFSDHLVLARVMCELPRHRGSSVAGWLARLVPACEVLKTKDKCL
jgi:hypothetical protein